MSKKPDKHSPFAKLQSVKAGMQAEEEARKAEQKAAEARARERGELNPRKPARAADPTPVAKKSTVDVWRPENFDQHLFDVAMAGVRPLEGAPKRVTGLDVGPSAPRKKAPVETKIKQALAVGGPELDVRWHPDGTVSAARRGCEFAVEALARFATPDETLDLHGLDGASAGLRVAEFVRSRRARGLRCVAVVHGRGARSPDGIGVLREAVVDALKVAPAANEIDGFCTAPDSLGGALLVALRH